MNNNYKDRDLDNIIGHTKLFSNLTGGPQGNPYVNSVLNH